MKIITVNLDCRGCKDAYIMFIKFGEIKHSKAYHPEINMSPFSTYAGLYSLHLPTQIHMGAEHLTLEPAPLEMFCRTCIIQVPEEGSENIMFYALLSETVSHYSLSGSTVSWAIM